MAPSEAPLPLALSTLTPTLEITSGRREGYVTASLDGDLLGRYGFAKLFTLPEATPWESVRKRSR